MRRANAVFHLHGLQHHQRRTCFHHLPRLYQHAHDAARQEPAVRNPRQPEKQPVIIRKESKLDRYPTPEQLDDLPSRPRGERPALLTRKG